MINMSTMRSFVLIALFLPLLSLAQDNTDVCRNLTPESRLIAEASGINVDALCSGQNQVIIPSKPEAEPIVVTQREPETVATTVTPPAAPDELQPFGYDLFAGSPTTFEPATGIPVSPDYLLGPGDTLQILFYGKTSYSFDLEINRDGFVNFPELGPIGLTGLTFDEAKKMLLTRISEQMIGVQASISLGELRSIQIFILGEAYKPGAYTVSSLSTITNALIVSGGVSNIASLRNIQLKRAGKVVVTLDLYDLLLHGDISGDLRLQPADVIYIPTVSDLVSIDGEVLRPAIYELKGNTTAQQLLELAGGLGSKAFPSSASIERINDTGFMTVIDLDLTEVKGQNLPVIRGDYLRVGSIIDQKENIVTLSGHVHRPGDFSWKADMRISDLISDISQFPDKVDLDYTLLQRKLPPVGEVQIFDVNLRSVLANAGSETDLKLFPSDILMVFSTESSRNMSGLLNALKTQARSGELARVVLVSGTVKFPGEYPMTQGMTVTKLIQAAGGLVEEAYTQSVEVSRIDLSDPEIASYRHQSFGLAAAFNDLSKDTKLLPYDNVTIRTIPNFMKAESIELRGEVRFPGIYNFVRGETISQVLKRAGGLNQLASPEAAIFTRKELQQREAEQLQQLQEQLEQEIAIEQLQGTTTTGMNELQSAETRFLSSMQKIEAVGRLVIDLAGVLDGAVDDISLKDGDTLIIPKFNQEIAVIGEIQYPTSHLYKAQWTLEDYIGRSGGLTLNADKDRIYIVRNDGSVTLPISSGFFRKNLVIQSGDTVIVPFNFSEMQPLTVWAEVTAIVYQMAIAAAAVNSF